jgi:selenide,water dikinase
VDPNLLVGHIGADDAGVYRLDDERAIVMTVDFFPPIVDDPYDYGRVAAANSLSDIYAMGADPIAALNIAAFPSKDLPGSVLADIFRGGASVAKGAGIVIVGGHTVKDAELKYGLSVVGMVHPKAIVRNSGARVGDKLVLTKPLGTGILSTALMAERLVEEHYRTLINTMTQLNRHASEEMRRQGVRACTDVTGYGLLGHGFEVAQASNVALEIVADTVPVLPGTVDMIREGFLTGGASANRVLIENEVHWEREYDKTVDDLLVDPQTSGGLLMSVSPDQCDALFDRIVEIYTDAAIIGRVVEKRKGSLHIL